MAKRDLKKLFRGKDTVAEELKEAKAIKSGKISPMQYAKGEKMEKPEMKKFAVGGSASTLKRYDKPKAPYAENEGPYSITRKGGERDSTSRVSGMTKKAATKQAKSDAEDGMDVNYEGMKTAYDNYKLSNDPSSKKITEQLRRGSVTAEKPLSKALQAADDAYYAGKDEVRAKIKTATKPKPGEYDFKCGGSTKGYAAGGSVSKGDGCATKGRTKGRIV